MMEMGAVTFLDAYSSDSTVRLYKHALDTFFTNVVGKGELGDLAQRYVDGDRDYKADLQKFLASLNNRPPKSVRVYISIVKTFLIENEIELPQRFWRALNRKVNGNRARTLDKTPSNEELRRIIMNMPINGKALYLTLASSGMRIGEALQLDLSDIDLDKDPARVSIRGEYTKSGDPRIAFISSEAEEYAKNWLRYRKRYLESAVNKSTRHEKSAEDTRLFPFNSGTARFIWRNALRKSDLAARDKSTNRYKLHPHSLRKFFRTQMGAVIPIDIVEALMGHSGYLTAVYRRYTEDQLAEFYKKAEAAVTIFGRVEESLEIKKNVTELEAVIHDQRQTTHSLVKTVNMLEDRLSSLEQEKEIEETIRELPEVSKEEILRAKKAVRKKRKT